MREYQIAVLKGDGIGPEIVDEAIRVLDKAGEKFGFAMHYHYALLGGCAIDETGVPLPQETIDTCKAADSTLLGAVGGPKWDSVPGDRRPEKGLLGIRGGARPLCEPAPGRDFPGAARRFPAAPGDHRRRA